MIIDPIYMDNHLLVVNKPASVLVQGDKSGDASLLMLCKQYIKERFSKPGEVFLGLVHRLDRPTSGIVIFARTSKAAARLSAQFRLHSIKKKYYALTEGKAPMQGDYIDFLARSGKTTIIGDEGHGKMAKLHFKCLHAGTKNSLIDIDLVTGRHHQIRVQLAHRNLPIVGDIKYGSNTAYRGRNIALQAYSLTISHPTRDERMTFETPLDKGLQSCL